VLPALALAVSITILPGFRSPSGNIRCYLGPPGILRCEIGSAAYAAALQQRCMNGPSVDWHGWELTARAGAAITCSGGVLYSPDTERPTFPVLPYGRTWARGAFACASARTGVTCRSRSGHGLFVSRERWRGW
jgi:hypothetical protein